MISSILLTIIRIDCLHSDGRIRNNVRFLSSSSIQEIKKHIKNIIDPRIPKLANIYVAHSVHEFNECWQVEN